MTDTSELTETQKAYNVAQHEMFQLAAYGHHRYHPSGECLTDEGKRQQRDYLDRIRTAREELEAAVLRLVAEHAERAGSRMASADWLRCIADDPAELSLLAVSPEERHEAAVSAVVEPPADQTAAPAAFVVWLDAPDGSVPTHDGIVWPDGTATIHHRHFGYTTTHPDAEAARRAAHGDQSRIVWPEPADQTALRDRIAEAIRQSDFREWPLRRSYTAADAVLAVLPEPADRAAELAKHVTRAIFALKSPPPPGSEHYRSGWDDGLEAAIDAARDEVLRRMADETATGPAQSANAEETPDDAARRFARRLLAVELLCSGRPGYHTLTVKQVLTAISEADDEPAAGARQDGATP